MKLVLWILLMMPLLTLGQTNKYGLKAVNLNDYRQSLKAYPEKELIDLEMEIPGLVLDIRYATTNNFMGKKLYGDAKAFARRPVADALKKAQDAFKTLGYGVKIFDAYRPYAVTVDMYESYRDTTYVASPYRGSHHNRGCALDMTIIDLKTGEELPMPTDYDAFTKEAWPSTPVKDPIIRKNRDTLIQTMQRYGFKVNSSEWWHFDFMGYKKFEVMDIDFRDLQ